ncbi:hypothetical protein BKA82DRAFT_20496 [Pisolithus tinctorius]|uniref:Uncharacterized protein n=1 Tax=Pisolithus tinctorius Marx 270 TaxID=870435 RepID=A0A0C3PS49_PISTI|nr:hypothetical protein BKA82DRAFT_20496 [Pisolithus tinctorius]KIO11931.1 hypothetical protein M404DRAFT_20496 [Pisolithus tinctorius Marx 270]
MCLPDHLWTIEVVGDVRILFLEEEPSHEDWASLEAIFSEDLFYELFSSLHTLHLGFFNLPFNIYAEGVDSLSLLASIPLPHLIQLGFEIYPPLRPDPD